MLDARPAYRSAAKRNASLIKKIPVCRQEEQQDAAVVESKATYALIKAH
jgi:hypothetical protein